MQVSHCNSDVAPQRAPTERQLEVLGFIAKAIQAGAPPTVRELGAALGGIGPNCVNDHLKALERRGLVLRVARGRSRNLRLISAGKALVRGVR